MGNIVEYRKGSLNVNDGNYEDTDRNFSPNLWFDIPDVSDDHWTVMKDDFDNFADHSDDTSDRRYAAFKNGTGTILPIPSDSGAVGIARLLAAADNDALCLAVGGSAGSPIWVKDAAGEKKPFVWEARFRVSSIAANSNNLFVGLAGEGLDSANGFFTDDPSALDTVSMMGFRILQADPDGLDAVSIGSTTETVVQEATASTGAVLTASTWVKVGMRFDGATFRWYVNGVEVGSRALSATAATTDPDFSTGEGLTLYLAAKPGAAVNIDLDKWGYAAKVYGI